MPAIIVSYAYNELYIMFGSRVPHSQSLSQQANKRSAVFWCPSILTIQITYPKPQYTYSIITNSALLQPRLHLDKTSMTRLEQMTPILMYRIDSQGLTPKQFEEEIKDFKVCVLLFDRKTDRYVQNIFPREMPPLSVLMPVTEEPLSFSQTSQQRTQFKEEKRSIFKRFTSLIGMDKAMERNHSPQTETASSLLGLSSRREEIDSFKLYVSYFKVKNSGNKERPEVKCGTWAEEQKEFMSDQIKCHYGPFYSTVQKRSYLAFKFERPKNDKKFHDAYTNRTSRQILFKQPDDAYSSFDLFIISREVITPEQDRTASLLMLSKDSPIMDIAYLHPWIVLAAQNYVHFIHSVRQLELFRHQNTLMPTQLLPLDSRSIIVVDRRRTVFIYHLGAKQTALKAVFHMPFLMPFSLITTKSITLVSGIDLVEHKGGYSEKHKATERCVYIIKHSLTKSKKQVINFDQRLQMVSGIDPKSSDINEPLTNMTLTMRQQAVACTWKHRLFLVSLKGYLLLQVNLKDPIRRIKEIHFPYNLVNFAMMMDTGELVRVGIQGCGSNLGAEVKLMTPRKIDSFALIKNQQKVVPPLCIAYGRSLEILEEDKQKSRIFLEQKDGNFQTFVATAEGIAYVIRQDYSYELKHIEL